MIHIIHVLIYSISFIFLLISCIGVGKTSSEIESNEVNNTIDLAIGFKNIQEVRLSEIADGVTFLPFETTRQSLMGEGQKNLIFDSKFIFYFDKCFDWNGKYFGSIIKKGQGPFEEPEGGELLFKDNHFYSQGSKFIEYDLTGKPTGKVRNLYTARDLSKNNFLRGGSSFSAVGESFIIYDYPTTLYYFNKNFETISSKIVVQTDSDSLPPYIPSIGDNKYVTYFKDNILFYNFINDTIFYVTETSMNPQWIVRFDDQLRLPTQAMLNSNQLIRELQSHIRSGSIENSALINLTDNKHKVIATYETEKYIFFQMTEIIQFAISRGKQPPDPYIIYYNKGTGKTIRVKGRGFVDDLLGMDFFYPQLGVFDEKLITFIWPFELIDYIKDSREIGREVNTQLLSLSKQVKEDDNPILILIHLKK